MRDCAGLNEFSGVGQEVGKALDQTGLVGNNRRKRLNDLDLHLRELKIGIALQDATQNVGGFDTGQRNSFTNDLGVLEGVAYEGVHAAGGIHDAPKVVGALWSEVVGDLLLQHAAETLHGSQWGAHVMGDG